MIKIAVAGAEGRMGQLITDLIKSDAQIKITGLLTRDNSIEKQGKNAFKEIPDIFIDFSHKEALAKHLKLCLEESIPMVIGVTGLSEPEKENIKKVSKSLPILLSPNMSIGANLIFKLLALSSKVLGEKNQNPDVAITEIHHKHKKDAPSGTAKHIAEIIAEHSDKNTPIQMSSLRLGEVMGTHSIIFALEGEQLEISHKADDRIIFAKGAVMAAKWLYQKPPGLYDMQDVLGLC